MARLLQRLVNRLDPGRLAGLGKQAGIVALGTLLCQVAILASTPWLTRLYAPAQFGQLALVLSLSGFVVSTACLRYDLAMPGAEDEEVLPLFLACCLLVACFALLVLLLCRVPWGKWLTHPFFQLTAHPLLLGTLVLGVGLFLASSSYCISRARFTFLACLRAGQGLVFAGLALTALPGLLWSHVVSFLAVALLCVALALRQEWGARPPSRREALAVLGRYKEIPLHLLPGGLMDGIGMGTCIFVVSSSYGLAAAGHYAQVQRLLGAPMLLASTSLAQVLLKHASMLQREGKPLWPLVRSLASLLAAGCLALLLLLLLGGSWALRHFLGPGWRTDTFFLAVIALAIFARSIVSPLSNALLAARKLRVLLIWQGSYFGTTLLALPLLARHCTFNDFLIFVTLHDCLQYFCYFMLIRWATLRAFQGPRRIQNYD